MEIRRLTARETDLLYELEGQCFHPPWDREALRAILLASSGWARLGSTDRVPVAYAFWRVVADEAELLRIGVVPSHRSRGYGQRLLERCFEDLAREGITETFLEVREGNLAARALYSKTGWRECGHRPRYYDDGEDAILLTRTLENPSVLTLRPSR